jgi:hypothetical protein
MEDLPKEKYPEIDKKTFKIILLDDEIHKKKNPVIDKEKLEVQGMEKPLIVQWYDNVKEFVYSNKIFERELKLYPICKNCFCNLILRLDRHLQDNVLQDYEQVEKFDENKHFYAAGKYQWNLLFVEFQNNANCEIYSRRGESSQTQFCRNTLK